MVVCVLVNFAITGKDINFEQGIINIDKTINTDSEGAHISPPKTENGIRVIYMPKAVMNDLRGYIDKLYGYQDDERIFDFFKKPDPKRHGAILQSVRGAIYQDPRSPAFPCVSTH